jgi:hypothetical protein
MRQPALAALVVALCLTSPSVAFAKVLIDVDLDSQTMHVVSKSHVYDWRVSSGKAGYETPTGDYRVLWMDKDHLSDEYNGTPMPNAIFFKPGFAIHGAYHSVFGRPASHGCIRLPVAKSAVLFGLVKAEGGAEIHITGSEAPVPEADEGGGGRRSGTDDGFAPPTRGTGASWGMSPDMYGGAF